MQKIDYQIPFYKNHYFHVYNRANGKDKLFYNHANYLYFLKKYKEYMGALVSTFAYSLMPNHFHILLKSETDRTEEISEQFRKLFISYSMSINRQENRKGSLLQRGVKRVLIQEESHLLHLIAYIHTNAVHHGLTANFKNYPYSSYKSIISKKSTILKRKFIIDIYGGIKQFEEYHENVKTHILNDYYSIEE